MAETYYPYTAFSFGSAEPSGVYTWSTYSVTVIDVKTFLNNAGTSRACMLTLSGDVEQFTGHIWNGATEMAAGAYPSLSIFDIKDGGGTGITGVSGLITSESIHVDGLYLGGDPSQEVFPTKTNYTFDPESFDFNPVSGPGAYVTFLATGPIAPTLENPTEDGTNYYLNKDWLLEMRWDDAESVPIADHTVYFAATGDPEFIPRDDRSRYSIVAYKMFLDVELDYETEYQWFVRKDLGGANYIDSEIWAFTTMAYAPPEPSTQVRPPYGGGANITVPTGENNMITVERLITIAGNKFFYEDV